MSGMESSAELVWTWANELLLARDDGRSCCWRVEARERRPQRRLLRAATPEWFAQEALL
jgi:6-pyruvoyltetrahydropterin/6-carboxytetrahydropterin synthase